MKDNLDRKIGIWLDHAQAHFIDFSKGPVIIETAYSNRQSQGQLRGETNGGEQTGHVRASMNENHINNRDKGILQDYYKMLSDRLKNYDDIFLFGSSTAKDELFNKLKIDKQFAEKNIQVKQSGFLTENQMIAEVRKYFNL
jgi:hypothetical protein